MDSHPKWIVRAIIASVLALAAVTGSWPSRAVALEVGQKAPNFTLPSTTGEKISLSQFVGKKAVLIEFYGADFAPV